MGITRSSQYVNAVTVRYTVAFGFQTVNRLNSSGKYVYHVLEHGGTLHFTIKRIYVFCVDLITNSDYFTVQH